MTSRYQAILFALALTAPGAGRDPAHLAGGGIAGKDPFAFPAARGRNSIVFRGVQGKSGFNLHSYLIHHNGQFWAIWSSASANEDDLDQQVVCSTSRDGHTWSEPRVLAPDPDGPQGPARWIARGLLLHEGKLTALAAYLESADYGMRGKDVVWKNLRLVYFQWEGSFWKQAGVYADDCMNNFPPSRFGSKTAMICRDRNMDVSVAILDDPAKLAWKRIPLKNDPPFDRMDEPTWYEDREGVIHMVVRDNRRSGKLIRVLSRDAGVTWTAPVLTNYPDATSKNFTGLLSNGWCFLINNPNPERRDPLSISFSRDGWTFSEPRNIREDAAPRRIPGRAKPSGSFQYPHAIEQAGSLWVIYSTNKEDIEISELPIASLGLHDPSALLSDPKLLAAPKDLPVVQGRTSTLYQAKAGEYQFNLHSYITRFGGEFWAVWSSGLKDEDSNGQLLRYATSGDGHTWTESRVLAPDPDGMRGPARYIARGIFTANGRLTALAALVEGTRDATGAAAWPGLKLMRFEWDGTVWKSAGVFLDNCMNNYPPRRFGGEWFMTCRDSLRKMYFARSAGLSNGSWKVAPVPLEGSQDNLSEPSEYEGPDGVAHLIFRDQGRSGRLRHSVSRDNGASWSAAVLTNYPDATSKNFSGRLSNGWYYLINNPDPKSRDPLTISFSKDGWTFSAPKIVRTRPPAQRFKGQAKNASSIQYPHAMEHGGSLWIIYSTNKEDIEITECPIGLLVPRE
jgi:predicted neuraminidase